MNSLPAEKKIHSFLRGSKGYTARRSYDREAQLPKLIGLWPSELRDYTPTGIAKIVALLRKAIRAERQRAQSGHWSYDLNRHLGLAEALKVERARLRDLESESPPQSCSPLAAAARQNRKRLRLIPRDDADHGKSAGILLRAARRIQFIGDADR